jgi:hypothetical protein
MVQRIETYKKIKQYGGVDSLEDLKKNLKIYQSKSDELLTKYTQLQRESDDAYTLVNKSGLGRFYNIFSSLLLITSYILFGIGTTIFINTCINFNKANFEDSVSNFKEDLLRENVDKQKLINQPLFEYLKPINFMFIDKFLLNIDGSTTPFTWVFFCVIVISVICIVCNIIYWRMYDENKFNYWLKELFSDLSKIFSFLIKLIPYIYLLIISTFFNSNQKKIDFLFNNDSLIGKEYNNTILEFENNNKYKDKKLLIELKNIIIYCIHINKPYDQEYILSQLRINLKIEKSKLNLDLILKKVDATNTSKINIIQAILDIYNSDYNINNNTYYKAMADNNENKKILEINYKKEKIKYINYIDDYFNIVINNTSTNTNYYEKYYLLGLIIDNNIAPDKDSVRRVSTRQGRSLILTNTLITDNNIASNNYNIDRLRLLKKKLNTELIAIKKNLKDYYLTVIIFYVLFLVIAIVINSKVIFDTISDLLFMYKINLIGVFTSLIILILIYFGIFNTVNK